MVKEITKSNFGKRTMTTPSSGIPQAKSHSGTAGLSAVTPEQRQIMICEAAYYIAEHRGFEPGHDMDDWFAAERQIDAVLPASASRGASSPLQS